MKSSSRILLSVIVVSRLACETSTHAAGLIGLYRFSEVNTSLPAADSSGNGLNGTYEGGVTPGQPGPLTSGPDTNSASFDGLTGDVFITGDPKFDATDMTIEFWMNLNGNDTSFGMPVTRGTPNQPWAIQINPATQTTDPRQISWVPGAGNFITPAIIQPNVWQHVAIVQSGQQAGWFVNGQPVAYGAVNAIPQPPANPYILIGRRGDGYNLKGSMDNVAIFNDALSQAQIQNDMANGVSPGAANLVAVWDFNESSISSPAVDSSGHGYNWTYSNGVALVASFTNTFGNAAQFDGSSGYVAVPPNPAFTMNSITIEFWVNVAGSSYANYGMPISRCGFTSGSNLPWTVQLNPTSSATNSRAIVWIASGNQITADAALPPDSWHHIAITQSGTAGTIYVDGQVAGSGTMPTLQKTVYIGKRSDGYNFSGSLADVAIFNLALSQSQIQNHMSNGVPTGSVSPEIFISQPPQNFSVQSNLVATFSVGALITGGNSSLFGYQWQKNGGNILGATNSTYTTPPTGPGDNAAQFACVVTYPGAPAVTSPAATLTILTPQLVALWKFDEPNVSSPAADSSGNGNVGSYAGGCSITNGIFGNAVLLDGASGYVDFPSSTNFDVANLTLEFWMKPDGSDLNYMMPVARGVNNPWTVQINPVTDADAARTLFWIAPGSQIVTPGNIAPNTWHHVAITQLGNAAAVFIDGILTVQGNVHALPFGSGKDILVGEREDGYNFSGAIDDMALFSWALTPNQIRDHMQHGASASLLPPVALGAVVEPQPVATQPGLTASFSTAPYLTGIDPTQVTYQWQKNGTNINGATSASYTTPPLLLADNGAQFVCVVAYPGAPSVSTLPATLTVRAPNLIALWKFDDNTNSTTAADSSGNGHNGTYQGTWQLVPGQFGTAVSLDGSTSDFVDFPSSPAFDLQNQTLEFWMNASSANGSYMMPVTRGVNNPWTVQMNPGGGTRGMSWINANGSIGTSIGLDVWHHVAITQQGNSAAIYVDGVLVSQGTPGSISVPSTSDIFVGKRPDGYPFTGLIDDMALFDLALSQPQIIDQMQHGASANLLPAVPATLTIQQSGPMIQLSWPPYVLGFHLQQNSGLANSANWTDVAGGTSSPVTLSISNSVRYYRLKK